MEKSLNNAKGLANDIANIYKGIDESKHNYISLENVNFEDQNQVIDSPRSVEACLRVGVKTNELFKLTEDQFRDKYPDVLRLKGDLFKYRYEANEKYRKSMIKLVKEEREKIIKEEKEKEEKIKKEEEKNKK